ncbi:hypothetical protein ACH5RR_008095 [Cinchona calisaya]|uniref:Regulator of Vps4 activity in the MVB pathway protein n=1 Tax=Cinchona calisaya TaxID=153742 RepID=A0ABD3AC94_9GENT
MFEGLLKSKFYSKCKSAIKMTKIRLEIIKRKRSAMQKYLKNDMIDLLKNGSDTNAYGRVEGLWNELNLSSCYDLVEQYCMHISSHLATMNKQRECPEECREAASSLMFAAARFSDLPELRELRTVFTERYGNSIESYVNKEFVNKLKSKPPTKDMKIQLMQDMALASGIEWNSKTLEQNLYKKATASAPDSMKKGSDDTSNSPKWTDDANGKIDDKGVKYKHEDAMKYTAYEREVEDKRQNLSHLSYGETDDFTLIKDIQVDRVEQKVQQNESHNASASVEENDDNRPFYYKPIRPPYTKPKISIMNTAANVTDTKKGLEDEQSSSSTDSSDGLQKDDPIGNTKPEPKSVRRRHLKTFPGKDNVENSGGDGLEILSSKGINEDDGNEGGQHLKILNDRQNDQRDEEERIMDRLLMHYSRKKLPHDTGESEAVLKPSPQHPVNTCRGTKDPGRDGPPTRVSSLHIESSPSEATKLHARASSFQPEMLNSNVHIHPKLPDYDDFVARLAALRANMK